jgi:glutamine amidotransferase
LTGLGWVAADAKRFHFVESDKLSVPHMGWNEVEVVDDRLFREMPSSPPRFYFVHSYHVICDDTATVAAFSTYGIRFAASIHAGHIYGAQFHPEKSHKFGMTLLKNFVALVGDAA